MQEKIMPFFLSLWTILSYSLSFSVLFFSFFSLLCPCACWFVSRITQKTTEQIYTKFG